jgi:hypothetical protein
MCRVTSWLMSVTWLIRAVFTQQGVIGIRQDNCTLGMGVCHRQHLLVAVLVIWLCSIHAETWPTQHHMKRCQVRWYHQDDLDG